MGVWECYPRKLVTEKMPFVYSYAFFHVVYSFIWLVDQSGFYLSKQGTKGLS